MDNGRTLNKANSVTNFSLFSLGTSVRIREAPPVENEACLNPAKFFQDLSYCSTSISQKDIFFKTVKTGKINKLDTKVEFFNNWDPFNCPITSCSLKNSDCS